VLETSDNARLKQRKAYNMQQPHLYYESTHLELSHTQGNINKYPVRYQKPSWLEQSALKINMRPTLIIAGELSWLLITTTTGMSEGKHLPVPSDTDFEHPWR